jgi:hypothetical protein
MLAPKKPTVRFSGAEHGQAGQPFSLRNCSEYMDSLAKCRCVRIGSAYGLRPINRLVINCLRQKAEKAQSWPFFLVTNIINFFYRPNPLNLNHFHRDTTRRQSRICSPMI